MCVLFTEDVGGVLTLEFDDRGRLEFKVVSEEGDYLFDEIGSVLKIKQYQEEKRIFWRRWNYTTEPSFRGGCRLGRERER